MFVSIIWLIIFHCVSRNCVSRNIRRPRRGNNERWAGCISCRDRCCYRKYQDPDIYLFFAEIRLIGGITNQEDILRQLAVTLHEIDTLYRLDQARKSNSVRKLYLIIAGESGHKNWYRCQSPGRLLSDFRIDSSPLIVFVKRILRTAGGMMRRNRFLNVFVWFAHAAGFYSRQYRPFMSTLPLYACEVNNELWHGVKLVGSGPYRVYPSGIPSGKTAYIRYRVKHTGLGLE